MKSKILPPYLHQLIQEHYHRPQASANAFAPSNIALIKYWGKRNHDLNLPINSSLSISMGELGTHTTLMPCAESCDSVWLNGEVVAPTSQFAQRITHFLDMVRSACPTPFYVKVNTRNTIPTAAGLASSASGFAALTMAVNKLLQLNLPTATLTTLARLGSGSATRSLYTGFAIWHHGCNADGSDSLAAPVPCNWQTLRVGVLTIDQRRKTIDSRAGMNNTVKTAKLYASWPQQAAQDLLALQQAITAQDFAKLGELAEHNALSMHATMLASWPPLLYWQPATIELMQHVWTARRQGVPVFFTMDAGPNIKLLFEQTTQATVAKLFPTMQIVNPWQ